ncbi:MAG: hypothetical protein ACRC7P_07585 [Enterovibrio sp.]
MPIKFRASKRYYIENVLFLLLLALLIAGVAVRCNLQKMPAGLYQEGHAEKIIAKFMHNHGYRDIERVHFTEDRGIKGVKIALPECDGDLLALVMPDGDEFVGLWQTLMQNMQYQFYYLFSQQYYDSFPRVTFWLKTGAYTAARRLHFAQLEYPGPVVAIAYPAQCTAVTIDALAALSLG